MFFRLFLNRVADFFDLVNFCLVWFLMSILKIGTPGDYIKITVVSTFRNGGGFYHDALSLFMPPTWHGSCQLAQKKK
jgi:hypothetical protein